MKTWALCSLILFAGLASVTVVTGVVCSMYGSCTLDLNEAEEYFSIYFFYAFLSCILIVLCDISRKLDDH